MCAKSSQTFIFDCLSLDPPNETRLQLSQMNAEQWESLLELAVRQQVAPLLYYRLNKQNITELMPIRIYEKLLKLYYANAIRNLHIYNDLNRILSILQEHHVKIILLKGIDLASRVYEFSVLRTMLDIDILVHEDDLRVSQEALQRANYLNSSFDHKAMPCISDHHLARMREPTAIAGIEIHWTITPPQLYPIDIDQLWCDAQPVKVAGHDVLVLSPEDLLLHICWHATYQHRFEKGIRAVCDIDAIVRRYQGSLKWDKVRQHAYSWNWEKGVYLALYLAKEWLSSPIPDTILATFCPVDFTSQLVHDACQQVLSSEDAPSVQSGNFVRMVGQKEPAARARIFMQRLFLPRTSLAQMYPVAVDSPRIYLYYFVRLAELLKRYSNIVWHFWYGNSRLTESIKFQTTLLNWLDVRE